ncbi:MAG TPA: hypothetical protein VFW13_16300 [Phenylobacterium sp.]|nr:hypothetical protein [Phenylobacterium sp.]
MSDIKSGDIVECIDDTPRRAESQVMPAWGALYTVTALRALEDGASVRLKELTPTCYLGGPCRCGECGWDIGRFRKVYRPGPELLASFNLRVCEPV